MNSPVLKAAAAVACGLCFLLLSCAPSAYKEVYPTLLDGKYDSEFPYRGCSKQLEEISNTVKMISCIAYYKSYAFSLGDRLTPADINPPSLKRARVTNYVNSESSGSATVIAYD